MKKDSTFLLISMAIAFMVGWGVNGWRKDRDIARVKQEFAQQVLEAQSQVRAEEKRRWDEREQLVEQHKERERELESAVAAERGTSERLRAQVSDYVQRARNSALASASEGGQCADPIGVLADLLTGADTTASQLAEYADRLKAAGLMCEQAYDSLRRE